MNRSRKSLKTRSALRSVYDLEEIQILYHSPYGEPSSVYYLAGWFMSLLGAGVKIPDRSRSGSG